MDKYKTVLKYVWVILLVTSLAVYFSFPELFTAKFLSESLNNNATLVLWCYILFTCIRPIFFIPSTAALILGIALYPDSFTFLLFINMTGIIIGAILLYFAGSYFTPEQFFNEKRAKSLPKIKEKINKHGFGIVLCWSFFPLVPTDLICFVSGATKMKFTKFIVAMFIGELLLVSIYLWTGKGIMELFY
jgi:uncharacterized membrane protein YdjX (TVP38/TMEM64 family)